jgi:hypothetical protein
MPFEKHTIEIPVYEVEKALRDQFKLQPDDVIIYKVGSSNVWPGQSLTGISFQTLTGVEVIRRTKVL